MSDIAGALFGIIQFLFGLWQEVELTKEQCAEMQSAGVAVYPLTQEQFDRLEKCKSLEDVK